MTASYPILAITEEDELESAERPELPVLTVVAGTSEGEQASTAQADPRDWDPYHVWKRLIRKDPDLG